MIGRPGAVGVADDLEVLAPRLPRSNDIRWILPSAVDLDDLSHSASAFTHETPTPCRPPDTLYDVLVELAARVDLREHDLDSRDTLLLVDPDRDAATVIVDADRPVLAGSITLAPESRDPASASSTELSTTSQIRWCKPAHIRVPDVHRGTDADRLEALEDGDRLGFVLVGLRLFSAISVIASALKSIRRRRTLRVLRPNARSRGRGTVHR